MDHSDDLRELLKSCIGAGAGIVSSVLMLNVPHNLIDNIFKVAKTSKVVERSRQAAKIRKELVLVERIGMCIKGNMYHHGGEQPDYSRITVSISSAQQLLEQTRRWEVIASYVMVLTRLLISSPVDVPPKALEVLWFGGLKHYVELNSEISCLDGKRPLPLQVAQWAEALRKGRLDLRRFVSEGLHLFRDHCEQDAFAIAPEVMQRVKRDELTEQAAAVGCGIQTLQTGEDTKEGATFLKTHATLSKLLRGYSDLQTAINELCKRLYATLLPLEHMHSILDRQIQVPADW